jgi:hypothetical protein
MSLDIGSGKLYTMWGAPYNSSITGGIAQLGERLHGMQEVSGSIPLTSTKINDLRAVNSQMVRKFHNALVAVCFGKTMDARVNTRNRHALDPG